MVLADEEGPWIGWVPSQGTVKCACTLALRGLNWPGHGYTTTTLSQWTAVKLGAKFGGCCLCNCWEKQKIRHCPEETPRFQFSSRQPTIMNRPADIRAVYFIVYVFRLSCIFYPSADHTHAEIHLLPDISFHSTALSWWRRIWGWSWISWFTDWSTYKPSPLENLSLTVWVLL